MNPILTNIKERLSALETTALADIHKVTNELACRGEAVPAEANAIVTDIVNKARSLGDKALETLHNAILKAEGKSPAASGPSATGTGSASA